MTYNVECCIVFSMEYPPSAERQHGSTYSVELPLIYLMKHQNLHHEIQGSNIAHMYFKQQLQQNKPKVQSNYHYFLNNRKIHQKLQQKVINLKLPSYLPKFPTEARGFQVSKHFQRVCGWTWMDFKMVEQLGELRLVSKVTWDDLRYT